MTSPLRQLRDATSSMARSAIQLGGVAITEPHPRERIRVSVGAMDVPRYDELAPEGMVRLQRMQNAFPNQPFRYNALYLSSAALPPNWKAHLWMADRRDAAIVWTQGGSESPGGLARIGADYDDWYVDGIQEADHVLYRSEFCKATAERHLDQPAGASEVLYDPVDTHRFAPLEEAPATPPPVILFAGDLHQGYQVQAAMHTFAYVQAAKPSAQLILADRVTGSPVDDAKRRDYLELAQELGIQDSLNWMGPVTQADAPDVYRSAAILVHTAYKAPAPGTVIEAMASGLPVAYSRSGGAPDLVGSKAGVGIEVEDRLDQPVPPDPEDLGEAVLKLFEGHRGRSQAAQERARDRFDLPEWIDRHREILWNAIQASGLETES